MRSPTKHVCLGLRLESLSLGHLFRLADLSSPFLQGGHASVVDLSDAVFVCSQPWRKAERDSRRWWFPFFTRLWGLRSQNLDFQIEHEKFSAYFAEGTDFPLAKQNQHSAREYGSPWQWRLLAIMMSDFHMTEAAALDLPAARAALLFSAKAEADGKLKLWTKSDDSFDSFCQEMDARSDVDFPAPLPAPVQN